MATTDVQPPLIHALLTQPCFDHPAEPRELIETHISWVILAGDFVYKIKKPIDLGFLDFSTLEKRRYCCEEELRLNRRLAAGIYLDVIAIGGTAQQPLINAENSVVEYAVKMRRFPQEAQLDRVLQRGALDELKIDAFARMAAQFHATAAVAEPESDFGEAEQVWHPVAENFTQIDEQLSDDLWKRELEKLEAWCKGRYQQLMPLLSQRKQDGFIRECHGDLHLRNLAWVDGKAMAFDCIEFNPSLRWIDVISDIAFLVMDLEERGEPRLAQRFLNGYLEISGDYAGLQLLDFYRFYRAMVRAKVAAIRSNQTGIAKAERDEALQEFAAYFKFAESYTRREHPFLIIARGVSASGKSRHSGMLLEWLSAIRIRSDVERKRLFGLSADESSKAEPGKGIYSSSAGEQTYDRLVELASLILDADYPVIIDATCLQRKQRERFYRLAQEKNIALLLLEFTAPDKVLRERIVRRKKGVSDADLAVLEQQLLHREPLGEDEIERLIRVDTSGPLPKSGEALAQQVRKKLGLS